MINKSIWLKGVKQQKSNILKNDIETDILIIGGGITGITTGYFLQDSNKKITIVDQNKIGCGHTSKSTGKLTYLQGSIYNNIEKIYDKDTSLNYLKSQKEAIEIVKKIIIDNNIKCDFESNNSYFFVKKKSSLNKIEKLKQFLNYYNIKYKEDNKIPLNFQCTSSIKVDDTAVFNPYKYVNGLKEVLKNNKNISIYENTMITNIEKNNNHYIVHTSKNKIKTKKIVFACHYPFFINPYFLPFKTKIKKAYLCAAYIDKTKRFNAISDEDTIDSIRYHSDTKNYIIYASEERSLGSNTNNEKNYQNLFWKAKTNLSENIKYYWFNYDIVTSDYLPIIGYLEEDNNNLLIGTGYNLWGMTNGTIAGKILSDLILTNKNKYQELFNPNRNFNINKINNYIAYNSISAYSFIKSKINKEPKFYKSIEIQSNKGIYKDENNIPHKVSLVCPHMKCNLLFNTVDKTWDCPCHGSRFDINGKIISGPSTCNIKVDK